MVAKEQRDKDRNTIAKTRKTGTHKETYRQTDRETAEHKPETVAKCSIRTSEDHGHIATINGS